MGTSSVCCPVANRVRRSGLATVPRTLVSTVSARQRPPGLVPGTAVALADAAPGDIVQFRDYEFVRRVETPSGWREEAQQRPHHTAIVISNDGGGSLTVHEQNVPEGQPVQRIQLHFSSGTRTSGDTTTTTTVRGRFWFYRPQPRRRGSP